MDFSVGTNLLMCLALTELLRAELKMVQRCYQQGNAYYLLIITDWEHLNAEQ